MFGREVDKGRDGGEQFRFGGGILESRDGRGKRTGRVVGVAIGAARHHDA